MVLIKIKLIKLTFGLRNVSSKKMDVFFNEYNGPIKSDKKTKAKRYNEGHEKTKRIQREV